MKNYILLIIGCLFYLDIFAQNLSNCNQPIANFAFQQRKREVQTQSSEAQKLLVAKQIAQSNCLATLQVKELAELFTEDYSRLEFAKTAYLRTFDRANFYEVYNAFQYFSTVFILHDFVLEWRANNANPTNPIPNNPNNNSSVVLNFPNLIYPNYLDYNGVRRCDNPLAENNFYNLAIEVNNLNNETAKINRLNQAYGANCLTTTQLMKLSTLLSNDNNRLDFLKRAYSRVYDMGNYQQAVQVFANQSNQQNLLSFIGNTTTTNPNPTTNPNNNWTPCVVSSEEFNDIRARIKQEPFSSSKMNLAKTMIRTKKCFTSKQISQIVGDFTFPTDKMDVAKFSYDYVIDQGNYYTLTDVFTFSHDKDALLEFINNKNKK